MTHKSHWCKFDPLDTIGEDRDQDPMIAASTLLGSVLFRHQFNHEQWDKAGEEWYNYTYFPCVFEGGQCYPYMVVYCCQEPVASAVGHLPSWTDYTVQTSGAVIKIDTAMMAGPDIVLAVKSAINLTRPANGSYLFITRAWGQYEQSEGTVQGPSLGLAVAACILGGVPVAYTGFTRNIIANVQGSGATQGSFDTRLSRRTGEIEHVSKLSAIVEDVRELGPKIRWAVQNNFPLVLPHSTQFDMAITSLLGNESWAASWMLPNLSRFVFTSAQLDAGYQFEKQGTKLMLATTVNDAILLGVLAAMNDAMDPEKLKYTNPEMALGVIATGETNYAKIKELLEKRKGKKKSGHRRKHKRSSSKSDKGEKKKKKKSGSKKGKHKSEKSSKRHHKSKSSRSLLDMYAKEMAKYGKVRSHSSRSSSRSARPVQTIVRVQAMPPPVLKKKSKHHRSKSHRSSSASRAMTPHGTHQMYMPGMVAVPAAKAAGSFYDDDSDYESDVGSAAGKFRKRRRSSSRTSSRGSSHSSRRSSRSRSSRRSTSRRYIAPGNYLSKMAANRQKNVTWGQTMETVPVQDPGTRARKTRAGAHPLSSKRYSRKSVRDIARSMYPTVPLITAGPTAVVPQVVYAPSIPREQTEWVSHAPSRKPRSASRASSRASEDAPIIRRAAHQHSLSEAPDYGDEDRWVMHRPKN